MSCPILYVYLPFFFKDIPFLNLTHTGFEFTIRTDISSKKTEEVKRKRIKNQPMSTN